LLLLLAVGVMAGCNKLTLNNVTPATVAVTPSSATVETGSSIAFSAAVSGPSNPNVSWSVNGITGGNSSLGTISSDGVYLAPVSNPGVPVSVTAASVIDSRISGSATVSIAGPPQGTSTANSYYGSGIQFDVLDNLQVAQGDVDYRFRASATGDVTGFTWYDIYVKGGSTANCAGTQCECDGYGCGTGGTLEVCIYPDDNSPSHLPTDPLTQQSSGLQASPLACVSPANLRSGSVLRTETFPIPAQLTKGTLYHLHWHNSDPTAAQNFISVDDGCVWRPTTPRQPTVPDTDLATLSIYNNGVTVVANTMAGDTPIFQLNYSDGTTQGQGYIGSWIGEPVDISGAAQVRESFTVGTSNRTVTGISVRVNRVSGASPLLITLATSDANVIEQGQIPASAFPQGNALTSDTAASQNTTPAWGTYVFTSAHVLAAERSYELILSAAADTKYQDYGIEKGADYNFTSETFFSEGHGEFSIDDGGTWLGFTEPDSTSTGSTNHTNVDIQFYFTAG
jgi:hypothetical protein